MENRIEKRNQKEINTQATKQKAQQPQQSYADNIKIGISHGDLNGVGYEILIKCFSDNRMMENCTPILYGSSKVLSYYKKMVDCPNLAFTNIRNCEQAETSKLNILNIIQDEVKIEVGQDRKSVV